MVYFLLFIGTINGTGNIQASNPGQQIGMQRGPTPATIQRMPHTPPTSR